MPSFDIVKNHIAEKSFRIASVMGQFDLQSEKIVEHFQGELPIENKDWSVGVIYGASGTGKTTIAKQIFNENYIRSFDYKADNVLDDMPEDLKTEQITSAFNSVGFATVWSWLKPYEVLSTGEKMRVDLARAILEQRELIVFDEYTSVVGREVAKIASFAIQKAIRKLNKKFIAVSCHKDIVEWLEPDWTFCTDTMSFQWGLLRRPEVKFDIYETDISTWGMFKKYHYLNTEINRTSKCFVGCIENNPVAFFSVMHFPHPKERKFKRGHRLVVLPDYQGIGLGHLLSTEIAEYYKQQGFRFIITSATKSLYKQRARDERWQVKRIGRTSSIRTSSTQQSLSKSLSNRKITFGYEYIGAV